MCPGCVHTCTLKLRTDVNARPEQGLRECSLILTASSQAAINTVLHIAACSVAELHNSLLNPSFPQSRLIRPSFRDPIPPPAMLTLRVLWGYHVGWCLHRKQQKKKKKRRFGCGRTLPKLRPGFHQSFCAQILDWPKAKQWHREERGEGVR